MSVAVTIDSAVALDKLEGIAQPDLRGLFDVLGSEIESQVRERIENTKTDPDGRLWKEWSPAYADSKHGASGSHGPHPGSRREAGGHTILRLDGGLLDSITYNATSRSVSVGTNLVYAGYHQATRPFLGLSNRDQDDVIALVEDFFEELLQ